MTIFMNKVLSHQEEAVFSAVTTIEAMQAYFSRLSEPSATGLQSLSTPASVIMEAVLDRVVDVGARKIMGGLKETVKALATQPGSRQEILARTFDSLSGVPLETLESVASATAMMGFTLNEIGADIRHMSSPPSTRLRGLLGANQKDFGSAVEQIRFMRSHAQPKKIFTMHPTFRWSSLEQRESIATIGRMLFDISNRLKLDTLQEKLEAQIELATYDVADTMFREAVKVAVSQDPAMTRLAAFVAASLDPGIPSLKAKVLEDQLLSMSLQAKLDGVHDDLTKKWTAEVVSDWGIVDAHEVQAVRHEVSKLVSTYVKPIVWAADADGNDAIDGQMVKQVRDLFMHRHLGRIQGVLLAIRSQLMEDASGESDDGIRSLNEVIGRLALTEKNAIDRLRAHNDYGHLDAGAPVKDGLRERRVALDAVLSETRPSKKSYGAIEPQIANIELTEDLQSLMASVGTTHRDALGNLSVRVQDWGILGVSIQARQESRVIESTIDQCLKHSKRDSGRIQEFAQRIALAKDQGKIGSEALFDAVIESGITVADVNVEKLPESAQRLLGLGDAIRDTMDRYPGSIERFNISMSKGRESVKATLAFFKLVGIEGLKMNPLTETNDPIKSLRDYKPLLQDPKFRDYLHRVNKGEHQDDELPFQELVWFFFAHSDLMRFGSVMSRGDISAAHLDIMLMCDEVNQDMQEAPRPELLQLYWPEIRHSFQQIPGIDDMGAFSSLIPLLSSGEFPEGREAQSVVCNAIKVVLNDEMAAQIRGPFESFLYIHPDGFEGVGGASMRGRGHDDLATELFPSHVLAAYPKVTQVTFQGEVPARVLLNEKVAVDHYEDSLVEDMTPYFGALHPEDVGQISPAFVREIQAVNQRLQDSYVAVITDAEFESWLKSNSEGFKGCSWGSRKTVRGHDLQQDIYDFMTTLTSGSKAPFGSDRAITSTNRGKNLGFDVRILWTGAYIKQLLALETQSKAEADVVAGIVSDVTYRVSENLKLMNPLFVLDSVPQRFKPVVAGLMRETAEVVMGDSLRLTATDLGRREVMDMGRTVFHFLKESLQAVSRQQKEADTRVVVLESQLTALRVEQERIGDAMVLDESPGLALELVSVTRDCAKLKREKAEARQLSVALQHVKSNTEHARSTVIAMTVSGSGETG